MCSCSGDTALLERREAALLTDGMRESGFTANTLPVGLYGWSEYGLNANGALLQEWGREFNNYILNRSGKAMESSSTASPNSCFCSCTHTRAFGFLFIFGRACVCVCGWLLRLCCHGDGWTRSRGCYCSWSRCCCVRLSVTHRYRQPRSSCAYTACAHAWLNCHATVSQEREHTPPG